MADRLVANYYVYRATLSVGFVTPIFTLFLLRTLSFTEVGALSALYSVVAVLGEVPTGYVGDRLGRRASLLLSVVFSVASLAGFVFAQAFAWYVVLYVLWALALTFRSGSLDAWLYDLLDERLDSDDFTRVRGRGDAVQQWTSAATMVGGGLLYGLDPTYPFVAAVAFNSFGILALLRLPKNARYAAETTERPPMRETLGVVREQLTRPPLRSLVLYVGLLFAAIGVARGYVQPMAVETLGPTAAGLGVDLPEGGAVAAARSGEAGATLALGLGVLYAALSVVSSVGGYYAGPLADRLGVRGTLLVVPMVVGVAVLVPAWLSLLALPAFVVMGVGVPLVRPVANGYLNDRVAGVGRATTLSAASMCYMTLRTPLALGAGALADGTTATTAVAAMGGVVLVGGGAVWLVGRVAPDARLEPTGGGGEDASVDG
ncbi:MFS transporter [Halomarina salina]|uniref:MFS transporter n=1 Tax=Halomarina salina TaxID=1872699 RepID=A0ABD5RKB8_9EURY|nr:MFS transporter [Halomarina salina]